MLERPTPEGAPVIPRGPEPAPFQRFHWLREPLLHFVLLGLGLFLLHAAVGGPAIGKGETIVISRGRIEQLTIGFARMHQRAPDPSELDGLVDDAIKEEIYSREAKALGLDRDDTIIRRRLRQKLEFVSEDVTPIAEPSDAELQAYLQAHPETFRAERRYGLTHVYLDPTVHGARLAQDGQALLTELRRAGPSAEISARGDASLLPQHVEKMAAGELSRVFGSKFESALQELPLGQWSGPVASGYGLHLVLLQEREEEHTAPLPEVRAEVRREWIDAQHAQANARYYAELRARYAVTVERAPSSDESSGVATGPQP
jgi:hypothetical protein